MKNLLRLALAWASVCGHADPKQFYFDRYQAGLHPERNIPSATVREGTFAQSVNPADATETRTFAQRYYFDDGYARGPHSPVLFYLCGEATCERSVFYGAIQEQARSLGAYMVALEHRYYGKSQPFPTLTAENLRFLSTDNAIADAAAFQRWLVSQNGLTGKWLVIGGSYPGSLSAYYRLKHPELVAGSLASSAPVRAEANFEGFDRHVFEVVGADCARAMREVVARVESVLDDASALDAIKAKFGAQDVKDPVDFLYVIADVGAMAAQYGYKQRFCSLITHGDALDGYAQFESELFGLWGMTATSDSVDGAMSLNPDDYLSVFGMRQWYYQSCNEYGYWQNAYHDAAYSVRSSRINAEYHAGICRRLFGQDHPTDTAHINETFYLPLLKAPASNIFFTNGSDDPWSTLSISVVNGNAGNPNTTARLIQGGSHCSDLQASSSSDNNDLKAARAEFLRLARKWTN